MLEHVLHEPQRDQALRDVRRHTPALQIETLRFVYRPDSRGMGATDVVVLDLQVGDRVRLCALGQDQVSVRLEGVRALGPFFDADEAGVNRMGLIGDDPLEQQL